LFQFMPKTAKKFNIDPTNAQQSAEAAAKYLIELHKNIHELAPNLSAEETWTWTLRAYNWGIDNVTKYFKSLKNSNSPTLSIPKETLQFAGKVYKSAGITISNVSNTLNKVINKTDKFATDLFNNPTQTLDYTLAEAIRMFGGVFGGLMKFADSGDASDILNIFGLGNNNSIPNSGPPSEIGEGDNNKSLEGSFESLNTPISTQDPEKSIFPLTTLDPNKSDPFKNIISKNILNSNLLVPKSLEGGFKSSDTPISTQESETPLKSSPVLSKFLEGGFESLNSPVPTQDSETSENKLSFFNSGSILFKSKEESNDVLNCPIPTQEPKESPLSLATQNPEKIVFPLTTSDPNSSYQDISDILKNVEMLKDTSFGNPSDSAFSDMSNGFYLVPYKSGTKDAVMSMVKKEYEARLCEPSFTTNENPLVLSPDQLLKAKWYDKGADVNSEMDKFLKDNTINPEIFGRGDISNDSGGKTNTEKTGFKNPLSELLSFFGHKKTNIENENKNKYQRGYKQIIIDKNFEGEYSKNGTRNPNTWYITNTRYNGKPTLISMLDYEYRKRLADPAFSTVKNPHYIDPKDLKHNTFAFLDAPYNPDPSNLNELYNFRIKNTKNETFGSNFFGNSDSVIPTAEEQLKFFNDGSFDPEGLMFKQSVNMKPNIDTNYSLRRAISENDISSLHSASNSSSNVKKPQVTTTKHSINQPQIINNSVVNSAGQPPLVDSAISEYINNLFSLSPMILQKQIETYSIGQQAMLI